MIPSANAPQMWNKHHIVSSEHRNDGIGPAVSKIFGSGELAWIHALSCSRVESRRVNSLRDAIAQNELTYGNRFARLAHVSTIASQEAKRIIANHDKADAATMSRIE